MASARGSGAGPWAAADSPAFVPARRPTRWRSTRARCAIAERESGEPRGRVEESEGFGRANAERQQAPRETFATENIKVLKAISLLALPDDTGSPNRRGLALLQVTRRKEAWGDQLNVQVEPSLRTKYASVWMKGLRDNPTATGYDIYCKVRDGLVNDDPSRYGVNAIDQRFWSFPQGLQLPELECRVRDVAALFTHAV